MQGYPRRTGHSGEFWKMVVRWRREEQTPPVFLPREPYEHEQYEKTCQCSYEISPDLRDVLKGPGVLARSTLGEQLV